MSDTAETIQQQACAWIAKLNGEPSSQDLQQFRAWMAANPAHRSQIRDLAKLWGELDILTELAVVNLPQPSLAANLRQRVSNSIYQLFQTPAKPAAALALVLAVTLSAILSLDRNQYSTGVGEQQLVTLQDGSTALLNTNSQIRVEYSDQTRNIILVKGQAHFDVMPNPNQPFNVYAG